MDQMKVNVDVNINVKFGKCLNYVLDGGESKSVLFTSLFKNT